MKLIESDEDDDVLQLMKLNEDWDQVYHNATLSLQQRMASLELENAAIKELNSKLLLRVEHQQVHTELQGAAAGKRAGGGGGGGGPRFAINPLLLE